MYIYSLHIKWYTGLWFFHVRSFMPFLEQLKEREYEGKREIGRKSSSRDFTFQSLFLSCVLTSFWYSFYAKHIDSTSPFSFCYHYCCSWWSRWWWCQTDDVKHQENKRKRETYFFLLLFSTCSCLVYLICFVYTVYILQSVEEWTMLYCVLCIIN